MNASRTFALSFVAAALVVAASAGRAQSSADDKPYTVECAPDPEEGGATVCRVDRGTYVGWRTFHAICHTCHATTGKELYRFKTPSGIIGNINTWTHNGKQYVGVLSGIGGWAGIGMAAGLEGATDGLGAVGAYRSLARHTQLGGVLTVFALP